MRRDVADQIITSRLLVMQTKRLLLSSARLQLASSGLGEQRVARLTSETEIANHAYRSAMLKLGSADNHEYWVVAYGRLAEVGRTLVHRLRNATPNLPLPERYEVSADAEMLEEIVGHWAKSMRGSMAESVA